MNEIRAAAGTDDQRKRATPATATPAAPAENTNQPPRPTRRRRTRRRRSRSASTDTGPGSTAEQPVVAAPPARPATAAQPAAASRSLTWDPEVELTADLRDVPTDKLAARIRHVLDQVSREVTLIIWIHDRPDATPVLPVIYQELRAAGYYSDTTRLPQGGQRMRISRRRWRQAAAPPSQDSTPPTTAKSTTPVEDSTPRQAPV